MKLAHCCITALLLIAIVSLGARSQTRASGPTAKPRSVGVVESAGKSEQSLKPELAPMNSFIGEWSCEGEFASNHAKIQSTISFSAELDGAWLQVRHKDLPPNRYLSLEMWGYDKDAGDAKKYVAIIHDNFGGVRLFTSSGLTGASLTWTGDTLLAGKKTLQRFSYQMENSTAMNVKWEVSVGENWRLGDELNCSKK